MCYSSEKLITLNILHEVVPTWYSFNSWVDWGNADKASCPRTQHTVAGVRPSTSVSRNRILAKRPICSNIARTLTDIHYIHWKYFINAVVAMSPQAGIVSSWLSVGPAAFPIFKCLHIASLITHLIGPSTVFASDIWWHSFY